MLFNSIAANMATTTIVTTIASGDTPYEGGPLAMGLGEVVVVDFETRKEEFVLV